jgi:transcriptional regulator with GAF, ATPase, and Fis domain
MAIDQNDFYRQVTTRVCRTLDFETGLFQVLQYMSSFIPFNLASLNIHSPARKSLKNFARMTIHEIMPPLHTIPLSPELSDILDKNYDILESVRIVNSVATSPYGARFTIPLTFPELGKTPRVSALIARLLIEGKGQGVLCLIARDIDQFTREHVQLLDMVREPLALALSNALEFRELSKLNEMLTLENRKLASNATGFSTEDIIGINHGLKRTMAQVLQIAPFETPALVLGETGTGKEVVATAIHGSSSRRDGPFIKVNCAALPETLIDSVLFGHVRGAFTGAVATVPGRFEQASGGTIFLDEIGDLPLPVQGRLLRVLQNGEIVRLGSREIIYVNVRVVAATHRNLRKMVQQGQFREDLWYRLNVFPISIPPLRERQEDVPELIHYFISKRAMQWGILDIPCVSNEALNRLQDYSWPGNVRELENMVGRALILFRSADNRGMLTMKDFMLDHPEADAGKDAADETNDSLTLDTLDQLVQRHIEKALSLTGGKIHGNGGAAALLGLNANTLRSKMRKLKMPFGTTAKKEFYKYT